jgi:hypothetical protein
MSRNLSSADVFDLVGEEARMSILRALLAARRSSADAHLSFTDLKEAAGINDTGRFNYHLGKLVDVLVVKTGENYRLSAFGFRMLAPMAAGLYDPDPAVDGIEVPGTCHECGESLRVQPHESVLQVVCASGHIVNHGLIGYPAVVADRPPAEAAATLGLLNTQATELGVAGVCPTCHGRTDGEIEWSDDIDCYYFRAPCEDCGNQFATTVGSCVATHPAVVDFLTDRGIDVRQTVPWRLSFRQAGAEEVVSADPLRLRVGVEDGSGDVLYATVDRDGSAASIERQRE